MKNWRILVVEDDPDGQALVAHILGYLDVKIDIAGDVDEALEYLSSAGSEYSAAIIDLALPGKDGWQLLSEIQDYPDTRDIPCVAVTAFHTSKVREEALSAGFTAYFAKPIDATSFSRELSSLL